MTTVITPSILAENVDQYEEQIERITGFAERAHVDISDGQFAPNLTVGLRDLWAPEGWQIDIHAMVKNVDEYIEDLVALRPNMILLHAESDGDVLGALQKIKQADIKAGLVLMRPTVPSTVVDLIKAADHVMIFSGELGRFGGSASLMQLEKIRLIKDINPAVEIGWDGGVMPDNAYGLAHSGVNVLVVGGAIQKSPNPREAYQNIQNEINKKGMLVVQLAFDTIGVAEAILSSLVPNTIVSTPSDLVGPLMTTRFAPASRCLPAPSLLVKKPVDSITTSIFISFHGNCCGSFSAKTLTD
jgi:ribulose-phosphate 3-epimerase